jgi:hypothetical protein
MIQLIVLHTCKYQLGSKTDRFVIKNFVLTDYTLLSVEHVHMLTVYQNI